MLSDASVQEFRKIIVAHSGVDFTEEEARIGAEALIRLYQAVYGPKTNASDKDKQ